MRIWWNMACYYGLDKPLLCSIVTKQTTNMLPENFSSGVEGGHLFIVLIFLNNNKKNHLLTRNLAILRGHWPVCPKVTCFEKP